MQLSDHSSARVLEENAECRRRVSPFITQPTEFLQLDIGDGVVMGAWMIKPRDFDATKTYPAFVFIYGEPHAQTVLCDWSGGGSNTLNATFRKPDVYHLGIAVASKPLPNLCNAWFQEIFLRTPAENPEGYRKAAAINFAEGLRGDLLIIHGTGETNTHIQITEGFVDRLIELGKKFDYMADPNRDHGLREGRGTTLHQRMLITRYRD